MDEYKIYKSNARQFGSICSYMEQICEFMIETAKNNSLDRYKIFISQHHKQTFLDVCRYEYKSKYIAIPIFVKADYLPENTIAIIVDTYKLNDTCDIEELSDEIKKLFK